MEKQKTAVDFLKNQLLLNPLPKSTDELIDGDWANIFEQAKELEREQKNNLPIYIHEGITNIHVYIEDGIVHVKPLNP